MFSPGISARRHARPAVYIVRTITPLNLNPQQMQDFQSNWKMLPGTLYSPQYITDFQTRNAPKSFSSLSGTYKAIADPEHSVRTVDLVLTYKPR